MAMEMDHSFTVPVPPDRAWDVLLDVERIAPCMPGATVEAFDGEVVTGRIKVKVGPVSLTYRGTAKFTERDPDAKVIVLDASGKETRGAGTASATVRASLEPEPDGEGTKASMHTVMNVTGRPAQFGRGVIVEVGGKLVEQFAKNLAQLITAGDEPAAGAAGPGTGDAAAAAGDGSVASAPAGGAESVATATVEPASSATESAAVTPSVSAAAASAPVAPASVAPAPAATAPAATAPTATAPTATAPAEDSLNLVRLVGPSILKRVVPVVAGAAVLAVLARLLFRRSKKD
jgi:carbon monoxide dehydrogenase subunit G